MFDKIFTALGFTLFCITAWAQAQVGVMHNVQGLVTVSDGATVSSATTGKAIIEGSRFVTGSNGHVTLRLENSCDIVLKPNQSLTVSRHTCAALLASVHSFSTSTVVASTAAAGHPLMAAPFMAGLHQVTKGVSGK